MNICMVSLDSPEAGIRDGITSHVYHISKTLGEKGHKVWIVALNPNVDRVEFSELGNVTNVSIPCRQRSLLLKMRVLYAKGQEVIKQIDAGNEIDVFHGHGGYVAPIASYRTNKPKILTLHNTYEYDKHLELDYKIRKDLTGWLVRKTFYPAPLLNMYRKWYYDSVDHIISVTRHNADVTSKRFNVSPDKFTIIPNGFDPSEAPVSDKHADPHQILYFGRLEPHKGVQVLIDAFKIIHQSYSSAKLGIAGDGDYEEQLRNQVRVLGLHDSVEFYGRLDRKQLFTVLGSAGVVVIPSFFEGIPVTLFEAAAMKKPMVVSRIPGLMEVMTEGESCLMFNPGDSDDLASRLSWMFGHSSETNSLGLYANKMINIKYDWKSITDRTIKVYEKTICGID